MTDKDRLFSITDSIKPVDKDKFYEIAERRLNRLIKPVGSLGRLEEFTKDIIAITGKERPQLHNKFICVFAGDHGVVEEGVSLFKQDVTVQMVKNFLSGGAAINAIANSVGANVIVVDAGMSADLKVLASEAFSSGIFINEKVRAGTNNIFKNRAMDYSDAVMSLIKGIEISDIVKGKGVDICATGDMGIGNTTSASAITCFYSKKSPKLVCGRGTGVNAKIIDRKAKIIEKAIRMNILDGNDPIDVLAAVGGLEIGEIAGFILGCAVNRVPVVVDGFISTAAALIALNINSDVRHYMFLGHLSKEKGHKAAVDLINKTPILDLSMRLGEGTGAAIAMKVIEIALDAYNNMLTFDEADVFAPKLNK